MATSGVSTRLVAVSVATALTLQAAAPITWALADEVASDGGQQALQATAPEAQAPMVGDPEGEPSDVSEAPSVPTILEATDGAVGPDETGASDEQDGPQQVVPVDDPNEVLPVPGEAQDPAAGVTGVPSEGADQAVLPAVQGQRADADPAESDASQAADPQPPVPGADAPTSPTDASTRAGVSIYDFLTQEQIDEALIMATAGDTSEVSFASILAYANQYCGLPYVWGGKDPNVSGGFDCSGFVSWVLNNVAGLGIDPIYTNAAALYTDWCTPIGREEARPGDLVFFLGTYGGDNYISHVGIYLGNGVMIDAGDPIGYDSIDLVKAESGGVAPAVFGRVKGIDVVDSSQDGWREEGGRMYYYENGEKVIGEKEIFDGWYYFDPEDGGAMATGFVTLTGEYLANGPKTVYYDRFGRMRTGEVEVDGDWYYFDPAQGGAMAASRFVRLSGAYLANGAKTVYYDAAGHMVNGELEIDGAWYYFDPGKGGAMATGFVTLTGAYLANGAKTVYYDANGRMVNGELEVGGAWYYFDPAQGGAMATSRFVRLSGAYLANGPKTVYYDANGRMVNGERQVGGSWYYFGAGGAMATGFVNLTGSYLANGSKLVFYDTNGRMVNGYRTIGGVSCYFDPSLGGALTSPRLSYADALSLARSDLTYTAHTVPYVDQNAEGAVMGCEGASLYMALRGQGALSGVSFASFLNSMPRASDNNPNNGFVGNPWAYEEHTGIYQSIYPAALASWGSRYGAVSDISGTSTLGIAQQVQAGKNVVAYVTVDFRPVVWRSYFFGNAVENAHVIAVVGFDPQTARFLVADPNGKGGTQWIDWNTFDAAYSAQRFAVAVG